MPADQRIELAPIVTSYTGAGADWDDFVHRMPDGTFFHLIGWKRVLERAFGFTARYLVARRGQHIVGVLPLFEVRGGRGQHCLQSVPFAVEGGVCAADEPAARALEGAAVALADQCGARYVELRDRRSGGDFVTHGGRDFCFRRALLDTDEAMLAAIPGKRRNMIRTGIRHGFVSRVSFDDLPAFYDLYARSLRRLGTPVFPRRYFQILVEEFAAECALLTVWRDGVPGAGVLAFSFEGRVLPYYAGSRRDVIRHAVNDFMYWELMRWARRRGCRVFDFGRSKQGSGSYEYKRLWGFTPEPLPYRVHLRAGATLPSESIDSPGMQLLRHAWRRLPLRLTKLVGPLFIRRYGPFYT